MSGASNRGAFLIASILNPNPNPNPKQNPNDFQEKIQEKVFQRFFQATRALLDGKTKTENSEATLYATSGGKFVSVRRESEEKRRERENREREASEWVKLTL